VQIRVKKGFTQNPEENNRRFYLAYILLISVKRRVYAESRRKDPQIFVRLAVINEKLST
jgi:hypothetical protein